MGYGGIMAVVMKTGAVWRKVVDFTNKYPVSRGMVSYAVIWPLGSLLQQHIEGREKYDYPRIFRFFIYGSCYVAPTLNLWMSTARYIWPQNTLRSAITKALVEQVTYTPFAMVSFYFGMSILEGHTVEKAKAEVADKFLPTYKVGVCIWPIIQTINYTVVAEKNRVPFVSFCSLIWSTFLAYMKHLETTHFKTPYPIPATLKDKD